VSGTVGVVQNQSTTVLLGAVDVAADSFSMYVTGVACFVAI